MAMFFQTSNQSLFLRGITAMLQASETIIDKVSDSVFDELKDVEDSKPKDAAEAAVYGEQSDAYFTVLSHLHLSLCELSVLNHYVRTWHKDDVRTKIAAEELRAAYDRIQERANVFRIPK